MVIWDVQLQLTNGSLTFGGGMGICCWRIEAERIEILALAFFFQGIIDTLLEFCEDKKHPELELKIQKVASFIVEVGQNFEPSFKMLASGKPKPYLHHDIFCRIVRDSIYQKKLAEVREKFLSIIDEKIELQKRKQNAEFCIDFLYRAVNTCLREHEDYVPRIPECIRALCAIK